MPLSLIAMPLMDVSASPPAAFAPASRISFPLASDSGVVPPEVWAGLPEIRPGSVKLVGGNLGELRAGKFLFQLIAKLAGISDKHDVEVLRREITLRGCFCVARRNRTHPLRIGAVVVRGQFQSSRGKNTIRHLLGCLGLDGIDASQIIAREIQLLRGDISRGYFGHELKDNLCGFDRCRSSR